MAGEDQDLQARRVRAEDVEDAFLANGIRVHQDIQDQHLRLGGREFLGDGNSEACSHAGSKQRGHVLTIDREIFAQAIPRLQCSAAARGPLDFNWE